MKKILLPLAVLLAGAGVGGGAAFGTTKLVVPPANPAGQAPEEEPTAFVPVTKIIAPLVLSDGRLAGYVAFDVQLAVPVDQVETVTAKLPLLLHAINMRTYRTPMAAGPDGMLPNLAAFRKLVLEAAPEAFGSPVVRKVAITQAVPA